jgi:hypothetical protein
MLYLCSGFGGGGGGVVRIRTIRFFFNSSIFEFVVVVKIRNEKKMREQN